MKKLFTFLLVFSLAFSPIWCLGEREVGLKTIFFGETSETQQIPSSEKLSNPLQTQKISVQNSTESMTSQGSSNLVTMSTDEIVDEIIATSADAKEVNGELIKSLVVVKATNVMLSTQVNNMEEYTNELETDLDTKTTDLINSNLKIEGLKGDVEDRKSVV